MEDALYLDDPPWGLRTLESEIEIIPATAGDYPAMDGLRNIIISSDNRMHQQYPSYALAFTFGAIARSGIKLKGSFEMQGAPYAFVISKTRTANNRLPSGTPATTFSEDNIVDLKPAFSGLKKLTLATQLSHLLQTTGFPKQPAGPEPEPWFLQVLTWSEIEKLTIFGPIADMRRPVGGPYYAEGVPPIEEQIFQAFASKPISSRLRRLRLGSIHDLKMPDLIRFVKLHMQSLENLRLLHCNPYDGGYISLMGALVDAPAMLRIEIFGLDPSHVLARMGSGADLQSGKFHIYDETPSQFQDTLQAALIVAKEIEPDPDLW